MFATARPQTIADANRGFRSLFMNTTTSWRRSLAFYWAFGWRAGLLCLALILAFYLTAAPIEAVMHVRPLTAALFDLAMLLLLLVAGAGLALRWSSRVSFDGYRLRVEPARAVGLTFGQAVRVIWAQSWRAAVVAVPLCFVLRLLLIPLVGLQALYTQLVYLLCWAAIGLWATREAIGLQYRGFSLRWVPEPATASAAAGEDMVGDGLSA